VINGATNKVIATIPVGIWPKGIAYDPSNGYIYVTNYGSGTVSIISTSASTSTSSNGYIYVTNYGSDTVSIISTSASTSTSSISSVTPPATSTTSTSTMPTPSAVPTWVTVAVIVVVAVLIVALLKLKKIIHDNNEPYIAKE